MYKLPTNLQTPSFLEINFQFSAKTFDPLYVNENLNFTIMQHYIEKRNTILPSQFQMNTTFSLQRVR